jgi:DNA-binding NarL/FixJ family response regulator
MEVVAEAENGRMTLELARELSPDVIIMDITMPDLNGIEACRRLLAEAPEARVVALSMHSDEQFVEEMLEAGASGYLLKDCALEELSRAIRSAVAGQSYLSPGIAGIVVKTYQRDFPKGESPRSRVLTPREREVLQLVAEGNSSKKISALLHVSMKTVEAHRHQIMHKLNIHSVAELTKYAIRKGLTSL